MVDRVKAAVDAKVDTNFVVMARTDALAREGLDAAVERAVACVEAGADAIFPEAILDLNQYRRFSESVDVPILANITEFGKTPLFNCQELADSGVSMVLYPLSAFRAISKAALEVYQAIAINGDQRAVLEKMQTRAELYKVLGYHAYEEKIDALFSVKK